MCIRDSANSVGEAAATIGGLFGAAGVSAVNPISLYYLRSFAVVFLIGIVGATPLPKRIVEQLGSTRAGAMVVDVLEPLVLVSVLAVSTGYLSLIHIFAPTAPSVSPRRTLCPEETAILLQWA